MLLPIGDYVLRLCPSPEERTELARVARGRARQGRRAGGSAANVPDRNANLRQDRGSARRNFPRFGTSTWCRGVVDLCGNLPTRPTMEMEDEIGRAACRERVCQYG